MNHRVLTDGQVISLVRQLPPDRKREALFALAQGAQVKREEQLRLGESQFRRFAAQRGQDWDRLSEDEREAVVDDLLHGRWELLIQKNLNIVPRDLENNKVLECALAGQTQLLLPAITICSNYSNSAEPRLLEPPVSTSNLKTMVVQCKQIGYWRGADGRQISNLRSV